MPPAIDFQHEATRARSGLVLDHPFFGALALRISIQQDDSLERPVIDGTTMRIPGKLMAELSIAERKAVIAAAVAKCGLGHHCRRGDRDEGTWNQASDVVINAIMSGQGGLSLPRNWPSDPRVGESTSVEVAYALLRAEVQPPGDGGGNQGDDNDDGEGTPQGGRSGSGGVDLEKPKGQNPKDGDGDGDGESGSGSGQGPGQALGPADMAQHEQEWRTAMIQAAQTSKSMGRCPGWAESIIDQWANPKVDWRARLREFIEMTARGDYDWMRADRQYLQRGMYVPDLYSSTLPMLAVAFDTSGSVSDPEVSQFFAELNSILEEFKETEVLFIQCDASVQSMDVMTSEDLPIEPKVHGRGGTAFSPVFRAIDESDHNPVCLVYCSDMECNDYGPQPDYPVLWVATGTVAGDGWNAPPFGEVVEITP